MDLGQDTDALFRQHSVPELRALHSQLQKEAVAKKGHLRVMVGERYRDVIEASDSIRHMKDASESLKGLLENCGNLLQIRASYEAAEKSRKTTLKSKDSDVGVIHTTMAIEIILTSGNRTNKETNI